MVKEKDFFNAVIPAPRAYVEVVEIKTLVVRMLSYLANADRKGFPTLRLSLKFARFFGFKNFNLSLKKGECRAIEQLLAKSVSACLCLLNKRVETS